MPEDTKQVEDATQGATAETERTFTQAEMEAIIGERLKRERAKYADYGEAKAALDELNRLKEAEKTELQKAEEERDRFKAELDRLNEERAHAELVAKVAADKGVDAALLARMSGDVEENAAFLVAQMGKKPTYEAVNDGGEAKAPSGKREIPTFF